MKNISLDKKQITFSIGVLIVIILFIISVTSNMSAWKTEVEAQHNEFDDRIIHIGDKVVSMREEITDLNNRANQRDIQLATISTDLQYIKSLLLDLKKDIKDGNNNEQ